MIMDASAGRVQSCTPSASMEPTSQLRSSTIAHVICTAHGLSLTVAVDHGGMTLRPPPPPPPPALPGPHGMLGAGGAGALMPLHGLPRLPGLPPNGYGSMLLPSQDGPQHGGSAFPALQVWAALLH